MTEISHHGQRTSGPENIMPHAAYCLGKGIKIKTIFLERMHLLLTYLSFGRFDLSHQPFFVSENYDRRSFTMVWAELSSVLS